MTRVALGARIGPFAQLASNIKRVQSHIAALTQRSNVGSKRYSGYCERREGFVQTSKYMILGGGMVAGYAAKEMIERGLRPGQLTIVSADNAVPYERAAFVEGFSRGKRYRGEHPH